ncbi:uncharacterized protein BYT42DRAFT_131546 [Radiomyces spectabilis]|uniref:uncharacterized protein n=1 Tax=Radiomyces spectabilis TaxID=64574 RepID=UPI00221FD6D8|nr:uncharacterized protein BYT42DRAFT_131546 [Radiomyces spectabilis]KAI8367572.1 hypothetical protein BYT42DRAFT_131546 [Radiomyces spectabilis]
MIPLTPLRFKSLMSMNSLSATSKNGKSCNVIKSLKCIICKYFIKSSAFYYETRILCPGEKASKVTKAARELHGKFLDDCHKLNIYGRKVDLLLSVCDIELGANEWKTSSSEITLIRQQSKNVRVNKCILEELTKNLSENGVNVDDCHLLCMDWNEFNGYMYIIKNVDDITVASLVRQLMIPTHFKEVPWFRETLACLLHYKKHYSNLASKLEDAMLIQDRRLAFHNIVESLSIPSVRTPSPSVYLSPKRGK